MHFQLCIELSHDQCLPLFSVIALKQFCIALPFCPYSLQYSLECVSAGCKRNTLLLLKHTILNIVLHASVDSYVRWCLLEMTIQMICTVPAPFSSARQCFWQ